MALGDEIFPDVAVDVIATFGTTLILRRTLKSYDPLQGADFAHVEDFEIPCSPPTSFTKKNSEGILQSFIKWIIPARDLTNVPDVRTDIIIFDGVERPLLSVDSTYSGSEVAIYTISCIK